MDYLITSLPQKITPALPIAIFGLLFLKFANKLLGYENNDTTVDVYKLQETFNFTTIYCFFMPFAISNAVFLLQKGVILIVPVLSSYSHFQFVAYYEKFLAFKYKQYERAASHHIYLHQDLIS